MVLKMVPKMIPNIPTKTKSSITTPPASRGVVCCAFHFVGIFGTMFGAIFSTIFGIMFDIMSGIIIPEKNCNFVEKRTNPEKSGKIKRNS